MIDLHMHLLPAIDDGAASLDVARAMLDKGEALGFTTLVATPHLRGPLTPEYERRVRAAFSSMQAETIGRPITVELGYEILLSPDLPTRLQSGERSRLGGSSSVLIELPFVGWPNFTEQVLFDLQSIGFRPVLAHPERYAAVQSEPQKALELAGRGVLLQVAIGSLVGLFGKSAQKIGELLIREDAAAILATDAHSAGQRFMSVSDGIARAQALIGSDRVYQLMHENPKALLESHPLPTPAAHIVTETADRGWRNMFQRAAEPVRV